MLSQAIKYRQQVKPSIFNIGDSCLNHHATHRRDRDDATNYKVKYVKEFIASCGSSFTSTFSTYQGMQIEVIACALENILCQDKL